MDMELAMFYQTCRKADTHMWADLPSKYEDIQPFSLCLDLGECIAIWIVYVFVSMHVAVPVAMLFSVFAYFVTVFI